MDCPNCKAKDLWRDSVDVGVGTIYGPYGCECGWSEDEKYNQLKGNGGWQEEGAYVDPFGGYWPKDNDVTKRMREQQ